MWASIKETVKTVVYALLIAGVFRTFLFQPFWIPSGSMKETLLIGDFLFVNKMAYGYSYASCPSIIIPAAGINVDAEDFCGVFKGGNERLMGSEPERGDVVVFKAPPSEAGRTWIKRVIGVAGDQIVVKGREIEVNGKKLERERVPKESVAKMGKQIEGDVYYESHAGRRYRVLLGVDALNESATEEIKVTVPERSVFVLGDNRDLSRDSRSIGPIHVGDVIGHVDYIFYPAETWSRFGVYRD